MSKLEEEWRPVKGYEGFYDVSDWGRVRSVDRTIEQLSNHGNLINRLYKGKLLKLFKDRDGYIIVTLCKEGSSLQKRVHRLVAEAFIPNPENKPQIDHINTIKDDNRVENIRWVTAKENTHNPISEQKSKEWERPRGEKHCWYGKKRPEHAEKMFVPIVQIFENGEIKEWKGISYCAEILKTSAPRLTNAVNGKNRKIGHKFRNCLWYKKEDYEARLNAS